MLGQLEQFFDHVLRLGNFVVLFIGERMRFTPVLDLLQPRRALRLHFRRISIERTQNHIHLSQNRFHITDDWNVGMIAPS